MKRLTMLVKALFEQSKLDLDLSVERDVATLQRRCEHEGLSFLTITLPKLSDALERGLEAGTLTCPTEFSRHGSLPRFMGGFFKRVFNKDGRLLPEPCVESIAWIRQICRFVKKLKKPCTSARERAAERHFLEVEGELRRMTSQVERKDVILDQVSSIIWSQVLPEPDYDDLVCHHGPGVTADRYLSNERYRIRKWNHRSESSFPSDLHCYPNYGVAAEVGGKREGTEESVEYLKLRDELPVRVVFVPKTQSAPRVIAIEPSHMQYMQQSVKDLLYRTLEAHPLTKRSIRFTRQDVNQRLAYVSSIDKRLATLDLKDASDRVHLHLVQRIFKNSGLLDYLEDARSLHATLPSGTNIVLTKYASMGSALCFPVEAMVFYTLIQSAMHILDGGRPSSRSIRMYSKRIDIYGDDIIVPVEYADFVVKYLESYALKVNVSKSFKFSNFRESCGADFYNGIDVKPIYAREEPHDDLRHWGAETIMSWNATADLFYMKGKWIVAQAIRDLLRRVVRRSIPRTRTIGSGLAHFSYLFTTGLRYNRDLQCWKQKRLHYDPVKRKDSIDGDEIACLNKWGISTTKRDSGDGFASTHGDSTGYRTYERYLAGSIPEYRWQSPAHSGCRSGPHYGGTDTRVSNSGIRTVQDHLRCGREEIPSIQPVACTCGAVGADYCAACARGEQPESDYCLTEAVQSDPLRYLFGDTSGLDFSSSTKRGSFKSKCRWVSLAG